MQLVTVLATLFLPLTVLANGASRHGGDSHEGPSYRDHPYRAGRYTYSGFPTGTGYPSGTGYPTGTGGFPIGTGTGTGPRPTGTGSLSPTGAPLINYKRSYPQYGREDIHGDSRSRGKYHGKPHGSKPIYPVNPTGSIRHHPTGGVFPTGNGGFPFPTGSPTGGFPRRKHPRMM